MDSDCIITSVIYAAPAQVDEDCRVVDIILSYGTISGGGQSPEDAVSVLAKKVVNIVKSPTKEKNKRTVADLLSSLKKKTQNKRNKENVAEVVPSPTKKRKDVKKSSKTGSSTSVSVGGGAKETVAEVVPSPTKKKDANQKKKKKNGESSTSTTEGTSKGFEVVNFKTLTISLKRLGPEELARKGCSPSTIKLVRQKAPCSPSAIKNAICSQ